MAELAFSELSEAGLQVPLVAAIPVDLWLGASFLVFFGFLYSDRAGLAIPKDKHSKQIAK